MNARLAEREYLAGDYSIADIACVGWAKLWERQGQDIEEFPNVKRWLDAVLARPAVQRGIAVNAHDRRTERHPRSRRARGAVRAAGAGIARRRRYCARVQVCERQISPPATQPESSMVFWPVIFMVPL